MFQITNPEIKKHMFICIARRYKPDIIINYITVYINPSGTKKPRKKAWLTYNSTSSNYAKKIRQDIFMLYKVMDPARFAFKLGLYGY